MISIYSLVLTIHNFNRWAILIFFALTLGYFLHNKFTINKMTKESQKYLKFTMIFSDIQLLVGVALYFFSSPLMITFLMSLNENVHAIMKTKETRFFIIEHPFMMILFWILIHVAVVVSKKDSIDSKKLNNILIILFVCLALLVGGIPWFRPLYRLF
jgi:heme A synthase